jgi:hypothetical protein
MQAAGSSGMVVTTRLWSVTSQETIIFSNINYITSHLTSMRVEAAFMTVRSLVGRCHCSGGTYCLHFRKQWFPPTWLHGIITQKTTIWHPTYLYTIYRTIWRKKLRIPTIISEDGKGREMILLNVWFGISQVSSSYPFLWLTHEISFLKEHLQVKATFLFSLYCPKYSSGLRFQEDFLILNSIKVHSWKHSTYICILNFKNVHFPVFPNNITKMEQRRHVIPTDLLGLTIHTFLHLSLVRSFMWCDLELNS